jgi:hypothetical protein
MALADADDPEVPVGVDADDDEAADDVPGEVVEVPEDEQAASTRLPVVSTDAVITVERLTNKSPHRFRCGRDERSGHIGSLRSLCRASTWSLSWLMITRAPGWTPRREP